MTAQQLRRLVELGITPTRQGGYRRSGIQRIRVVDALAEAGFAPEQLGQLIATGAYNLDWASVLLPEPTSQLTTTLGPWPLREAQDPTRQVVARSARQRPSSP